MPTVRVGRRYRFAASHRLHTPLLGERENRAIYGKCNNPHGHGHNFVMEVVLAGEIGEERGRLVPFAALDAFVSEVVLQRFDHVDLNTQIEEFAALPPTSENLARVVLRRLTLAWPIWFPGSPARIEKLRIWETPRNIFEEAAESEEARESLSGSARTVTRS